MMDPSVATAMLRATAIMEDALRNAETKTGSVTFHFKDGKMLNIVPTLAMSRSALEAAVDPRTSTSG